MLDILFYIALLSNKTLVLFGLDFRAGNSKFQRPKVPARSAILKPLRAKDEANIPRHQCPVVLKKKWSNRKAIVARYISGFISSMGLGSLSTLLKKSFLHPICILFFDSGAEKWNEKKKRCKPRRYSSHHHKKKFRRSVVAWYSTSIRLHPLFKSSSSSSLQSFPL